jgi:hypothetical protein
MNEATTPWTVDVDAQPQTSSSYRVIAVTVAWATT